MLPVIQTTAANLATELANNVQIHPTTSGGAGAYLKMDYETGEWLLGSDQEDVSGSNLIVNVGTLGHGWTLWHEGKVQKVAAPINQPLPPAMEPIIWRDRQGKQQESTPSESRMFQGTLLNMEGEPEANVIYDVNSYGGRKGCDDLISAVILQAGKDATYIYPMVELDSESYDNKTWGKTIFNPVFRIVAWCDVNGEMKPDELAKVEAKPEPEPVAEPEPAAKPARRRRRVAAK